MRGVLRRALLLFVGLLLPFAAWADPTALAPLLEAMKQEDWPAMMSILRSPATKQQLERSA